MAGDLMIRIKFAGTDKLSRLLDGISGASKRAARGLADTNLALRTQKTELRDVQRQIAAGTGNMTGLIDRERALEKSIVGANRQLERQKKFVAINARTARASAVGKEMVASGQAGLFSTAMLAAPIIAIAKAGADFQSLQNRMRVLGLGDGAVKDLTAFAGAMNVAGSSVNENMRYLLEAQGVFRESGEHSLAEQLSGAKLMAPLLARMHVVAQATGKELSEDEERYFLRFVEQAGGLTNSKRAAELTNGLFRALQSSGGNVQASDYQGFLAHAGIAGSHLSNRSMFADMEPLIGELHEQAGVGLATGFKMAAGIKVNSRAANEYMRLGLWDRNKVNLNSLGGVKSTKGNPLNSRAADLLQHDPVEFYRQIVMPAYARSGIKTSEDRAFENAKLFGGTGGNLYNLIDKQLPTILRSRMAYQKTQSLDTAYNQTNDSFFGQEGKLRAAGKDFMVAAGTKGGLLDNVTSLMITATAALRSFTAFGSAHPTAFAWIGTIVTDLILVSGGLSVAKIAFGGLLGPIARVWGLWSKIRTAGSIAAAFPMLANPVVLAIGAIVVGLSLAALAIYNHWDGIKKTFAGCMDWLRGLVPTFKAIGSMMLEGLLSMLDPARLAKHMWSLGKTAVSAFKGVLGIHSPSRVFAGLGGHITSGLGVGIDRGADHPVHRTRALAARLATAMAIGSMAPAIAVAGGANSGAAARAGAPAAPAPTIVLHYHAAPGAGDMRAQARELWAEIQKIQAVQARSSYRDAG